MKSKKVTKAFAVLAAAALVFTGTISTPTTAQAAGKKVTVTTQAELNAALKNKKVTVITIKTKKNITLKVKAGDYDGKKLVINAPKATINNKGSFEKITIKDGKTVYDKGALNSIVINDKNELKLVAGKQSYNSDIKVKSDSADIVIVNNGSIDTIDIEGKSKVTVKGNATNVPFITSNAEDAQITAAVDASITLNKPATLTVKAGCTLESLTTTADAAIRVADGTTVKTLVVDGADTKVELNISGKVDKIVVDQKAAVVVNGTTTSTVAIENNAPGSTITSEVKTDVSLNADAKVNLEKGSEGSSVKSQSADVKPDVSNNTDETVTITDAAGKDATIESGKTSEEAKPVTPATPDTPAAPGTSTGGSSSGGSSSDSSGSGSDNTGSGTTPGGDEEQQAGLSVSPATDTWDVGTDITAKVNGVSEPVTYTLTVGDATKVSGSSLTYKVTALDFEQVIKITATTQNASGDAIAVSGSPFTYTIKSKPSKATFKAMTDSVYQLYKSDQAFGVSMPALAAFGTLTDDNFSNPSSVTETASVSVNGTLNKVTGWEGFNSTDKTKQSGYYLPLLFEVPTGVTPASGCTIITVQGDEKKEFTSENLDLNGSVFSLFHFLKVTAGEKSAASNFTIAVDWDGESGKVYKTTTYTLDLSSLTLNPETENITE